MVTHQCCEKLGAGEVLLNCVDKDGQKDGFDLGLIKVRNEARHDSEVRHNSVRSALRFVLKCGRRLVLSSSLAVCTVGDTR